MPSNWTAVGSNQVLWATLFAWLVTQGIKVAGNVIRMRRFNFKWLFGTGGMPSSHSAGVAALATAVGLAHGFDTPIFAVTTVFAIIIMFDAQGVRRMVGRQASVLNQMMEDLYVRGHIGEQRLKELLGHTPLEVFVGALIGMAVAAMAMRL